MVLAGGGLKGSGESLVMSLVDSSESMVPGSGERGAMNALRFTRAESRTGGVGAATVIFNFSRCNFQPEVNDLHRSNSRSSSALGEIGP